MSVSPTVQDSISGQRAPSVNQAPDQNDLCAPAALILREAKPVHRHGSGLNIRPRSRPCQTSTRHTSFGRSNRVVLDLAVPGGALDVPRG